MNKVLSIGIFDNKIMKNVCNFMVKGLIMAILTKKIKILCSIIIFHFKIF